MGILVAKTDSAVAVTDAITTLIDWVNIESLSGFTVMVENASGGSANDITDVQIDTSVDGGVTVLTDQHAGVPAVPIASGAIAKGTFTETAAFIRVRALCATGQDTTANAFLLADSSLGRICLVADVRDRLGISVTDHDSTINRIILGIEKLFNSYCSRTLLINAADATEYYTGEGRYLQLKRYPIVSITSIKESWDWDWANTDAFTADEGYRIINDGLNGVLYRNLVNFSSKPDSIQVIYKGGYCAASVTPGDGEHELPDDLREAAILQASFIFKRKDDIGLTAVSFEGGSISKFSAMDLLPMVKDTLNRYRKVSL